ncbi:hypothetical protein LEMLEM_LOCUS24287 [Lemmus lemmus]
MTRLFRSPRYNCLGEPNVFSSPYRMLPLFALRVLQFHERQSRP